jgi:molybdenum cofactor cytidylyltransferase
MSATAHVRAEARLPAVVLAAGMSTRMGQFKPLMELGGEMLLHRVLAGLQASGAVGPIIVVTGHRGREVAAAVAEMEMVQTVENKGYAEGEMLSSIRAGLSAVPAGAAGVVLTLADHAAVRAETVGSLVEEFQKSRPPVVLPVYRGRRGHPLVIAAELLPEIRALGASETLRTVIHRHLSEAKLVAVDDPGVVEDLDTPEDWARAEARCRSE